LKLPPPKQLYSHKTVQVKNGAKLFWREEKRTKKIGEENLDGLRSPTDLTFIIDLSGLSAQYQYDAK